MFQEALLPIAEPVLPVAAAAKALGLVIKRMTGCAHPQEVTTFEEPETALGVCVADVPSGYPYGLTASAELTLKPSNIMDNKEKQTKTKYIFHICLFYHMYLIGATSL